MKSVINIYRSFYSKVFLALLLFSLLRLLFYFFNYRYFRDLDAMVWLGGLRYDWMTISILFMPFALAYIFLYRKQYVAEVLFIISSILSVVVNVLDFEYFKFTFKRTTFDLFTTKGIGTDVLSLAPRFLLDYWYLWIIGLFLIWVSGKAYRLTQKGHPKDVKIIPFLLFAIPTIIIWGIGFRGGLQYKPLSVMQAGQYTKAANIPLVVNTAFTIAKTYNKGSIEPKEYFKDPEDLRKQFDPIKSYHADSSKHPKSNVVLIILESFSEEYIGFLSGKKSYTPFLDSLLGESLVFESAYANGKKSIEALPAILSSIPSLMNNSYISGNFGSNKIQSIASVLKDQGYESVFYHGGANGTMGFDAFAQIAGIDDYVGLTQYPNEKDHDGNWGIFDEPFLQFVSQDLNERAQPFFATIFTLSSHHPYPIPEQYKGKFPQGEMPILESVAYADHSLRKFFETAQQEDWYAQTLFVITADHTAQNLSAEYGSRTGIYKIPLAFYRADSDWKGKSDRISQQADIFPSIVNYLGIEEPIFTFGNSVFNEEAEPFAVNYLNDTYQLIEGEYSLEFDGEKSIALYAYQEDPLLRKNLLYKKPIIAQRMENRLKAIIQQYHSALIKNQMTP